ncbi:MAG: hypothetical protein RLP44_16635 [Aggregatilineales bacterium]
MNEKHTPQRHLPIRFLSAILAIVIVLSGLLAIDLANRGMFWRFAWSVTGEEDPIGQIRGVAQWVSGLRRPQPDTARMTPIQHTNVNPFGVNTFFQLEPDPDKIDAGMQMISDAGFGWIRQQFEWAEIEVDGRGQFTDSRNDINGDGQADTINAWDKYDRIVELADTYGLDIQVRLDNPPAWARNPQLGDFAPPEDTQDFVNYAVAVAERYRGRVQYYQIWNEPNLTFEWGGLPVNPEGYTELLCRTYDALKAVDPNIVVITGALAPTIDLSGANLMDFIYLQRMYDAGAGDCFDILSVQGYGLFSGPTDRRMRPTTVNIDLNIYIRDLMVANGDAHKPIWMSEAAWNFVPSEDEHPEEIIQRYNYGQVTPEQAGEYIVGLYERTQQEWSWVGVINYWFFTRPNDTESNQAFYYFRMVEPDYDPNADPPFPPLPVYTALSEYINTLTPTLYTGVHQVENNWAIKAGENVEIVETDDAQFSEAMQTTSLNFVADGTHIFLRWRGDSLTVAVDDENETVIMSHSDEWQTTRIDSSLLPQSSQISISADTPFVVDSVTVSNRLTQNLFGVVLVAVIGIGGLILSVIAGLMGRFGR